MLADLLARFVQEEDGATAIEYALLATLIGMALVASFTVLGDIVGNLFDAGGAGNIIANRARSLD